MDYDNELKRKECVLLSLQGAFYHASDDGACVLGFLMEYKVKRLKNGHLTCGFNVGCLERVESALISAEIDYCIRNKDVIVREEHYSNNNFGTYRDRFDKNCIIEKPENKKNDCSEKETIENQKNRQTCDYIQGRGLSLENAMVDLQNRIQKNYISNGMRITSLATVESGSEGGIYSVSGIIVYTTE